MGVTRKVKNTRVNFSSVTSDGQFSGYATVWGAKDFYGDIVVKGAFADVVENRFPAGDVKLLYQHDHDRPAGRITEMREDSYGLFIRGQLNMKTETGREVQALMESGDIDGLSIGYDEENSEFDTTSRDDARLVLKIDLWEVSIVTFPALEEATVDSVEIVDTFVIDKGSIRRTNDGYMTTSARVARTGIQLYTGRELGRPELERVRVYRPPETVFDKKAMASLAHRPITNDHPPVPVNSENWRKYVVGNTGDEVARDGDFIRVPLAIMDAAMIRDIDDGKKELSVGYAVTLDWKSGRTDDGQEYDAVQTGIRANHLAVVTAARGGPSLRLGDETGESEMQKIIVDGVPVEVANDVAASVISRHIGSLEKNLEGLKAKLAEEEDKVKKAKDALDAAVATHATAIQTKDAEAATLKKQLEDAALTPAKLDAAVKARAGVIDSAKKILGDKLVVDGKTDLDIQRQVVDAKMGDTAKGWNEVQVQASFAALTATAGDGAGAGAGGGNPLADALSGNRQQHNSQDAVAAAYVERDKNLSDAWRGPAAKH